MRTTLDLDDDVLTTVKEMARAQGLTFGQLISDLARKQIATTTPPKARNGILLFALKAGSGKPNLRMVNRLRDLE